MKQFSGTPGGSDNSQMTKLVKLATFSDRMSATLAQTKLRAHGINSVVSGQDSGGAHPFRAINTRLLVDENDYTDAKDILEKNN